MSTSARAHTRAAATAGGIGTVKVPTAGLPKGAKSPTAATAVTKPSIKRDRAARPQDFKSSVLTIRVKDQLKTEATDILAEIGISLPEAVRVFLSRVVSDRGFPFRLEVPNAATRAAMEEARQMSGTFATAEELFDDLEKGGPR